MEGIVLFEERVDGAVGSQLFRVESVLALQLHLGAETNWR
jgi:hypothetical protein